MCRLLFVKENEEFDISGHLNRFAGIAAQNKEYQGHGWGYSCSVKGKWYNYKNIKPVWEDVPEKAGKTSLLLAHARSAFKNEGIYVENNMPFIRKNIVFIFNGELHGVRIRENGRTGADKIFNYLLRFYRGSLVEAVKKGTDILRKRSEYIRAMNIIISDFKKTIIFSHFNEDKEYFTMYLKEFPGRVIVCSDPWPGESGWVPVQNNEIKEF